MAVPSGDLGDLLVTDRTEAVLLFPQVTEPASPFQSGLHIHVETFFKIRFPGWVVGIGFRSYLRMPLDADRRSRKPPNHFDLPLLIFEVASKHPTIGSFIGKVFVFHPPARFTPVSTTGPFPNRLKDGVVNGMENRFTDHVTMIERPSAYLRIKGYDQFASGQVTTFFDPRPDTHAVFVTCMAAAIDQCGRDSLRLAHTRTAVALVVLPLHWNHFMRGAVKSGESASQFQRCVGATLTR